MWRRELLRSGLGGIAAAGDYVVFGDRDADDFQDVWRCLNANTGEPLWEVSALAIGELDYGNSPRATPLLARRLVDGKFDPDDDRAFLLGAFGDLLCVSLKTGMVVWQRNLALDFDSTGERPWGYCGSPLLVDNKLIVNPGAPDASLVALDPETGDEIWRATGANVGYGSFIAAVLGGKQQIVGYDASSLGGWDVQTGKRLWKLIPPIKGDFNVPTPLSIGGRLLVATENNGTRLYEFDSDGRVKPTPVAANKRLHPNMSTPVIAGDHLLCVDRFLYSLDLAGRLKEQWKLRDPALGDYGAMFTDGDHVLVVGKGRILLVDPARRKIVSRADAFEEKTELYSHAALERNRLYLRGEHSLICMLLTKPVTGR